MYLCLELRGTLPRRVFAGLAGLLCCVSPAVCLSQPLGLAEAMDLAQARQPLLESQRAGVRAAHEAQVAATQLPDPKLKAGIVNLPVTSPDAWSLTRDSMTMRMIGVMQEFPREEKRRLRGELLDIERRQKQAELESTRRAIRRDVALAWLDAHYAQRAAALIEALQRESQRKVDTLVLALKTNRSTQADLAAARVDLELIQDRSLQISSKEAGARAELARWIGDAAERPIAAETVALPEPKALHEVATHLIEHPHLAGFDQQVKYAEADAALAREGTRPDWSVEVSYGARGSGFSDMVTLQFGVDLPVFPKNRQVREVSAKLAAADRARALREDNLREMQSMLKRHHVEWATGKQRLERYRIAILPQAAERVEAALAGYRGGRAALDTVIEARRAQLELVLQQLMLEADTAKAQAQIVFYDQREDDQ